MPVLRTLWRTHILMLAPCAGEQWLQAALQAATYKLPAFTPQGLCNTLWALARMQASPAPECLNPLLQAIHARAPSLGPQDHANTLWALARLQLDGCASLQGGSGLPGADQGLGPNSSNNSGSGGMAGFLPENGYSLGPVGLLGWAFGAEGALAGGGLGGGPSWGAASADASAASGSSPPITPQALAARLLACAAAASATSSRSGAGPLAGANPQELANSVWAASVLGVSPPSGWTSAVFAAAHPLLPAFGSQELSNMLLGCARLGLRPPPPPLPPSRQQLRDGAVAAAGSEEAGSDTDQAWWAQVEAASAQLLPLGEPQHTANMAFALALAGWWPSRAWTEALLAQVGHEALAPRLLLVLKQANSSPC